MDVKDAAIELKDFVDCLKDENNKLMVQLSFAKKCIQLFEDYRKCLIGFANSCVCEHNFNNQMIFNRLEHNYVLLVDEDMKNSAIIPEKTIKFGFNKQQKSPKTNDNITDCVDQSQEKEAKNQSNEDNSCNVLSNKLSDRLKDLNDSKDYRLMYLKNRSDPISDFFQCNWFKCVQIFESEANLSQHIRSEHFRVLEYSEDYLFDDEPKEMTIKCEPDIEPKLLPQIKVKAKTKRGLEEYLCDWIGCDLEFRTDSELRRHQNLTHIKQKQTTEPKMPRFCGLKPLTIHSLDLETSQELTQIDRPFKCDFCDKTYTRKDSLKYHMSCEHKSGDSPMKMFFCDHCEYQSKNNSHMKRHILRRHTNERPYKCDLGDCHPEIKCFATLDQLRSHQLNVHPNQIF